MSKDSFRNMADNLTYFHKSQENSSYNVDEIQCNISACRNPVNRCSGASGLGDSCLFKVLV
jgi:hypothetical protein